MRKILVSELLPGTILGSPIYSERGALLLPEGKVITRHFLELLSTWGIKSVYVVEELESAIPVPEHVRKDYCQAFSLIKKTMETLRLNGTAPLAEVGDDLKRITLKLASEPGILSHLIFLREHDDYTFHHSVSVGVIATLLGSWLGLSEEELAQLASAGSMHDLGKAFISIKILNKPGRLSPEELELMKKHPSLGYELLAKHFGPEAVPARVAFEHHERIDGRGYPMGVKSGETLLLSRIVAVADVFHAMTSDRVYRPRQAQFVALAQLREEGFGSLDPRVVQVFLGHVVPLSIGRRVRLSNGSVGTVILAREQDPTRPIVQVGPAFVDLAQETGLALVGEADE